MFDIAMNSKDHDEPG